MKKTPFRLAIIITTLILLFCIVSCITSYPTQDSENLPISTSTAGHLEEENYAKYIFLFIGDGMGITQRYAADQYIQSQKSQLSFHPVNHLLMNSFPSQGMAFTQNLSGLIPDSASSASAIATGHPTTSGAINMNTETGISYLTITEQASNSGWKVGIITTTALNDATPAAFFSHQPNRENTIEIMNSLPISGFDFFAGAAFEDVDSFQFEEFKTSAQENAYDVLFSFQELEDYSNSSGKVIVFNSPDPAETRMPLEIERLGNQPELSDFVTKGIELLDNPDGFLMIVEGGLIDLACHYNDSATTIHEVIALDRSIYAAYTFYKQHPNETLIIVTADHETGGMSIGSVNSGYSSNISILNQQKTSYFSIANEVNNYRESVAEDQRNFDDLASIVFDSVGFVVGDAQNSTEKPTLLSDWEMEALQVAYQYSMNPLSLNRDNPANYLLYGNFEPFAFTMIKILNQKAGIGWTSFSHTGGPIQVSAIGVKQELFSGNYPLHQLYHSLMEIALFNKPQ